MPSRCRRVVRWAAAPVILACACHARPLAPAADAGAIVHPPSPDASPADGSVAADRAAGRGGTTGGGAVGTGGSIVGGAPGGGSGGTGGQGAAGDGGVALCPAVDTTPPPPTTMHAAPAPTQVPFSCAPMPPAFFFPPPGADVPGRFSRCASYDVGAATSLAVSPAGALVALVTGDGIARVVQVGSQRVIGVLASPRAMIDYAAFTPDGAAVMTVARGQREVTLWRGGDWQPIWRVTLPGTPYYHLFGGGVAIAPDGKSAVVSPGSDTFLIDVASGAIRAQRTAGWSAVLDVGYGWGGRRIVVAEAALAAHCVHDPNGGTVTVLDAGTLAPIATVADLGAYGQGTSGWRGIPTFRASPTDDLVLVGPTVDDPAGTIMHAFKLSDGGALPTPPLGAMPQAFMPDGASVLIADGGALVRARVADGSTISVEMLGAGGPMAVSGDGTLVAIGGSGGQLLRAWKTQGAGITGLCAAADPIAAGYLQTPAALSGDGQSLALATGTGVKVLRRDGLALANLPSPGSPWLSRSGALLAVKDSSATDKAPSVVLRVSDGAKLGEVPFDAWNWAMFAFSAGEDRLYSNGMRAGAYRMDVLDLAAGTDAIANVPQYSVVIGASNGCPVLYQGDRGAWRSCGACDDPAVGAGGAMGLNGTGAVSAALSADGRFVAIRPSVEATTVSLWRMPPYAAQIATLGPRPALGSWQAHEYPVAVAPGGGLALTAAEPNASCYDGPQFEILVHDVFVGTVTDHLPPMPAAFDAGPRTIAYGAQLWCAR